MYIKYRTCVNKNLVEDEISENFCETFQCKESSLSNPQNKLYGKKFKILGVLILNVFL